MDILGLPDAIIENLCENVKFEDFWNSISVIEQDKLIVILRESVAEWFEEEDDYSF